MQTTVGIIGGGPTGLLLSYLLDGLGIDNEVLERRSRAHVEARVRAGQLDHASVMYLRRIGVAARLDAEGLPQKGMNLRFRDRTRRIDLEALTGGAYCTIYGQSALTKDLISIQTEAGHSPTYEVSDVCLEVSSDTSAAIVYRKDGGEHRLNCRFIVGCDGAHGVTRAFLNSGTPQSARHLPFSWIGLLSDTPPISRELTYVYHPEGFALWSMRSPAVSRTYLQCARDDRLEDWSDDRFWTEFSRRMGPETDIRPGPTTERVMVRMQGYVAACMQRGNVMVAGDAGHIVPPSAAKGLNMAIADVADLVGAFKALLFEDQGDALEAYGRSAMRRAWLGQYLSWRMTDLLHSPPDGNPFENEIKLTQLDALVSCPGRLREFCDSYVGKEALA
jgi:p-hydroxybenzoate 3-monooxygenase